MGDDDIQMEEGVDFSTVSTNNAACTYQILVSLSDEYSHMCWFSVQQLYFCYYIYVLVEVAMQPHIYCNQLCDVISRIIPGFPLFYTALLFYYVYADVCTCVVQSHISFR